MSPGRPMRILYGVLLTMIVLIALGGIGLLERMTPAIGRILEENVASARAVELMLGALARSQNGSGRAAFHEALQAAEANVTEPAETAELAVVRAEADAALSGDEEARGEVTAALLRLGAINRDAMQRADAEARRLGSAGRWALAFLALFGVGAGVVTMRRVRAEVLDPIVELTTLTHARRGGDLHRRARPMGAAALRDVLSEVNSLLDQAERVPAPQRIDRQAARAIIASLLDRSGEALAVMDADGGMVAASREALDVLSADAPHDVEPLVALPDAPLSLVRVAAAA